MYLTALRTLVIFSKLVTSPVFRKIEEEGHILELSVIWSELKVLLKMCGQNTSSLMDGEVLLSRVNISDDNMYHELFKETNEVELDTSTQECLEMTCYSCALVRQSGGSQAVRRSTSSWKILPTI